MHLNNLNAPVLNVLMHQIFLCWAEIHNYWLVVMGSVVMSYEVYNNCISVEFLWQSETNWTALVKFSGINVTKCWGTE